MKKKVLLTSILSIVMCLSLIAGATFALFTSESKVNIAVTSGNVEVVAYVDVESVEYKALKTPWTKAQDGKTTFDNLGGSAVVTKESVVLTNVLPGDAIKFDVKIENNSTVKVNTRTIVELVEDTGLFGGLVVSIGGAFTSSVASDWALIDPGMGNTTIPVEIVFPETAGNEYQGKSCAIDMVVEAVQGNVEVLNSFVDNEDGTYTINDKYGLWSFAKSVNSGTNYLGETVILASDIDLANALWAPIGNGSNVFRGTFDGDGYTIKNLKAEGTDGVGLFGTMSGLPRSKVQNLNIENVDLKGVQFVGAVVGKLYQGEIDNCHVLGSIKIEGNYKVGGITGEGYCAITNSSVDGTDKLQSYIKATHVKIDLEGDKVGGIIGLVREGVEDRIVNCSVANITIEATRSVGGVVGTNEYGSSIKGTSVENVIVATNASEEYVAANSGKISVSGFAGELKGNSQIIINGSMKNVSIVGIEQANTGKVYGKIRGGNINNITFDVSEDNVVALVTIVEGFSQEIDPETNKTVYRVQTIDGLKYFRDSFNGVSTASGFSAFDSAISAVDFNKSIIKLDGDIDLAGEVWAPIGNSSNSFDGIFDGQGYTIKNLVVEMNGLSNAGFFGMTQNGEIKNVTFENAKVVGRLNVGVVAGTPYTSKYTNITVKGLVQVDGMAYVGGVGGKNAYASWDNIVVDVEDGSYVKANSVENGTAYRSYVGGVIGFMGEGNHVISNVKSNINVIGSTCDVGGVVGIAHYGNSFKNIECSGNVEIYNAAEAADAEEIGGIAGVWMNSSEGAVTFTDCKFSGTLKANITEGVDLSNNTIMGNKYYMSSEDGSITVTNFSDVDGVTYAQDGITGVKSLYLVPAEYSETTVNVADGITEIGGYAFAYNQNIEKIVLPSSVTTLNDRAFRDTSASTVVLNEGLKNISYQAFRNALNVETVVIPSTVETISKEAFQNSGIKELTIPANVKTIEYGGLRDMKNLETVTIEGNVDIPLYAFRACTNLKTVYIKGDDVTFGGGSRGMIFTNKENGDGSAITIYVENETVKERLLAADTAAKDYGGYKIVVG